MKKFFLLGLVMLVLMSAFYVNVGTAKASCGPSCFPSKTLAPIVVVNSPEFKALQPGAQVHAQMGVDSRLINVSCIVKNNAGDVLCKGPKKYAGQPVTLFLSIGDLTLELHGTLSQLRHQHFFF